jgi:hypothetical protein
MGLVRISSDVADGLGRGGNPLKRKRESADGAERNVAGLAAGRRDGRA